MSDWHAYRRYVVFVDAGSSGSRVQIYSYKDSGYLQRNLRHSVLGNALVHVELGDENGLHWQFKEEPGLSAYATMPNRLDQHIAPLLDYAQQTIPEQEHASTLFYLYATAGMRLVDEVTRDALLVKVCGIVEERSKFVVDDCARQVRVISGEEEGIFGWITVNYLMNGFHARPYHYAESHPMSSEAQHSFGFMDMGGASAQIAYEPSKEVIREHAHDMSKVTLYKLDGSTLTYDVFVSTFLGFGTNEARKRHVATLTQERVTRDPCLNPGTLLTINNVTLEGTGDFGACQKRTLSLLNTTIACHQPPCLFNGVHFPGIDFTKHRFFGISEYWHAIHDTLGLNGPYSAQEYEKVSTLFCKRHWKDIQMEHASGHKHTAIELDRLQWQCFKAAWLSNVLHSGFHLPKENVGGGGGEWYANDTYSMFQSIDRVNEYAVTWTLGAVLMHAIKIDPVQPGGMGWLIGHHGIQDGVEHRAVSTGLGWGMLILLSGVMWVMWTVWRIRNHQHNKKVI